MFDQTVLTPFEINPEYYLWLTYTSETGQVWYVTSNSLRTEYQLWKGKHKTAKTAIDANELYKFMK